VEPRPIRGPVLLDSGPAGAVAAVTVDGNIVEVLWLRRWDEDGGWFVERGQTAVAREVENRPLCRCDHGRM
jgi:hypothetical protein